MRKYLVLILSLVFTSLAAEPYEEGRHYIVADPHGMAAQPKVLEFFSYGCPHCFSMHELLKKWQKEPGVDFELVPVAFSPKWELYSELFYVIESMGLSEKLHDKIFHLVHQERRAPHKMAGYSQLFAEFGVKKDVLLSTASSFIVQGKLNYSKELAQHFNISSIPTFVINNRYQINNKGLTKEEDIFDILNTLPKQLPLKAE